MADRVRGLGRLGGRAAAGSGDLRRRPLHAAGPRPGRRRATGAISRCPRRASPTGSRTMRPRARGSATTLAAQPRLGQARRRGARRARRRAGRRAAQPDRRGVGRPARSVERAADRPSRQICRQERGREAHRDRRLAGGAKGRRGGAVGARFDRLGVQRARRRRVAHPGRAGLCAGPRRRHRRPVRRRARRSMPRSASISAMACGCTSASAFEPALRELAGKTVAVDPERAVAAIFDALDQAGAKIIAVRDPTVLPKAIKNAGRDRRPPGGPGARRRGDQPLPQMGRGGGAQGRRSTN